jgi:exodeoxyribonuclease V alpha subunit
LPGRSAAGISFSEPFSMKRAAPPRLSPPAPNPGGDPAKLSGTIEIITFHNEQTGFTVARLRPADHDDELRTIVGVLPDVAIGAFLLLAGQWHQDPRHGPQFKVDSYQVAQPTTPAGIEKYLGSGLIKGVGPVNAARIVDHFGSATLEVLDHDPGRLAEVAGLGRKLAARIKQTWQEQQKVHKIMLFLQDHQVPAAYAAKIYKTYGADSLRVVRETPYRLTEDVPGVGFRIADRIAVAVGLPVQDPGRLKAGLLFVLNEAAAGGHCFLERSELLAKGRNLLGVSGPLLEARVPELVIEEKIVQAGERLYPALLYYAELGVAGSLPRIGDGVAPWGQVKPAAELEAIRGEIPFALAPGQAEALRIALAHRLTVLTGGPGTGKSTILKAMILLLEKKGVRIALTAPTGRAAKRLAEASGREAATIHRLLGFSPHGGGFTHNADTPLAVDLLIVDEVSMLDIVLANALLRAVPHGAAVLLVGDGDQLPSVGPGNFLKDLIASGLIPVARLDKIFRQERGSLISLNAARINKGQAFDLQEDYQGDKDFYYIARESPEEIEREVVSLCAGRLAAKYGFDSRRDVQVLTPMRKGLIGVENLNRRLQQVLNDRARGPAVNGRDGFLVGDKVMQLRNNYEKEVFNGDLGLVTAIADEDEVMTVEIDGRAIRYEAGESRELQLAYAVTIHKAQGSEFPCVILPVHTIHYPLLQRNLLYTGITRGRRLVVVVGSRKALAIAIGNNREVARNTGLRARLQAGLE